MPVTHTNYDVTSLPTIDEKGSLLAFLLKFEGGIDVSSKILGVISGPLWRYTLAPGSPYVGALSFVKYATLCSLLVLVVTDFRIRQSKKDHSRRRAIRNIGGILSAFRDTVFSDHSTDEQDQHRVTLFRFDKKLNRLEALARTGHLDHNNIACFRVSDNPDQCEGVAGLAWRKAGQDPIWVFVPKEGKPLDLPTSHRGDKAKQYAEATRVTADWLHERIRSGRPLSRAIAAIAILKQGRPWGVVVVDSKKLSCIETKMLTSWSQFDKLLLDPIKEMDL